MKYKGMELKEFTSDKPVAFDPPKMMIVWDDDNETCRCATVRAYLPHCMRPVVDHHSFWNHCAEVPTPRLARPCELSRWLAQGNGECMNKHNGGICTQLIYHDNTDFDFAIASYAIRKWDDDEWHEPTADYMGLEEK